MLDGEHQAPGASMQEAHEPHVELGLRGLDKPFQHLYQPAL
jgi:hypothetical protein